MLKPAVTALAIALATAASAAIPLRWTVETSRAQPAAFEAYQGETLDLEATLTSYGKPLTAPSDYALNWQTNGMGRFYWSTNCTPVAGATNVMRATWRPEYDVGARVYNCFIGLPGDIYHAAFRLHLLPSPGAVPGSLPLPTPTIDFSRVTVLNPPWPTNAISEADAERISNTAVETNAVTMALIAATNDLTEAIQHLTPTTREEIEAALGWRIMGSEGTVSVQFGDPSGPSRDLIEATLHYRLRRREDGTPCIEFDL